ncbi:hypothetical protein WJX77_002957 [Trebouxia sp. C0004]
MLSSAQSDIAQDGGRQDVQFSHANDDSAQLSIRRLTGQTEANLHTNSLHQSAELGEVSKTSVGSVSYKYSMHGIKKGAPATCYGLPCTASACYPSALVSVKTHVNYVNVTAVVEFSRRYNISTCNDLTSGSCELAADGVGAVQGLTQLSDTSYQIDVQLSAEGVSKLWWTPTDCSGAAVPILLSPITYDITPPTLAIIQISGKTNVTLAQSTVDSTATQWRPQARHLLRNSRKLQYFTLTPTSSSSVTYGAKVVFSFSEAVSGFGEQYAFVKGGALSAAGLTEAVSQQQYNATIVADNTKSALLMVTGSTYQDLAGNVGAGDVNATVAVSVLSTDSTDSSMTTRGSKLSSGDMAGVIIGCIVGAVFLALMCSLCVWRRSKIREAKEEERQAAAEAAVAAAAVATDSTTTEGKAVSKANLQGTAKGAELDVKPSAPTSVPLRVRFGTGSPTGTVVNPMFAQDGTASRSGSESSGNGLTSMRSELPLSTLAGSRVTSPDEQATPVAGPGFTPLSRTDREGTVDERSDSAMLEARPSRPLIQDPSGVYAYGSGSYEGPIVSFPSDAAGQAEAVQNAAATPRARPLSRLANASEASGLPHAATTGSHAWGEVDLNSDE